MQRSAREVVTASSGAIFLLTLGGTALANSGIQLPLNQYSAGSEQATLLPNGDFSNRGTPNGMGEYPDPPNWVRNGSDIIVDATMNPPPLNPAAAQPYSAQVRSASSPNSYTQDIAALSTGQNYVLSAYIWNWGRYDSSGFGQGDLATVKVQDSTNTLNNVSMTLEGQGLDAQPGSSGRFMYIMLNQVDTAGWGGTPQVVAIGELGTITGAIPTVWAQFDNVALTPAENFAGQKWSVDSSSDWTTAANWLSNLVPNEPGAVASFPAVNTIKRFVHVNGTVTAGQINFNSAISYEVDGAGTVNLAVTADGQNNLQGVPEIAANSGTHTISAHVVFDSTSHLVHNQPYQGILYAASSAKLTLGNMTATGVDMFKNGAGEAQVNNASANSFVVNAGKLTVAQNGGNSGVMYVNGLTVAATAALDLNDNDLVVTYGSNPSPFSTIQGYVFSGYSSTPDPSKTGIVSATGQVAGNTILAVFDNALVGASDWPSGSGHTVDANSVIGKYTYFGDVDLDGQVTPGDYGILDANFGTTPPPGIAIISGDADFDGSVTPGDYGILDANFGSGVGSPLSPAAQAVPEPTGGAGLFVASAAWLLRRRMRKH
jgi:hypothetical protein